MSAYILNPGYRVGKYEVLAHIATGGMGAVYKALDLELRRTVALKVLPTQLAHTRQILERFRREARHAARLNHRHIVTLYECGYDADQDLHYLALEFIDGIDLGAYIGRKGRLEPEEARRILVQAARALDHAYGEGVVHRDIKPSNFLLARTGDKLAVKMTDFGLALVVNDEDFKVTKDGATVGTIDYLSPEQARDSRSADIRSDIYSLGCTAYHMLAGKAPFAEGGLGERVLKHLQLAPPDVRQFNPAVSARFWTVLQTMLAKKPEDRYPTPAALLADLKRTPADADEAAAAPRHRTDHAPSAPLTLDRAAEPPIPSPRRTRLPPAPREPDTTPAPAPESSDDLAPLITAEQQRAAAEFHARAAQVLEEGGGEQYARELLANCLKLDPFTPAYRETLRKLNRRTPAGTFGRWLGTLNVLAIKAKMRTARASGDWRRVLEHGEEVLARQTEDVDTHRDMAEAAEKLGLPNLAMWLLEQARDLLPQNTDLMRAMARLFENRTEWKPAIALWERVLRNEPDDAEARRKINQLAVSDHLAKGLYRR
jgi:serine/threonine-protein kinase